MVKKKGKKYTKYTRLCILCIFNGENHPAPPVWLLRFRQKECTAHPVTRPVCVKQQETILNKA